jgi:DNA-directed RNA polymerase subunit RPC12/RpoP
MSDRKTFFRTCPACGRRFEVRLASKTEVGAEDPVAIGRQETDEPGRAELREGVPTMVTAEDSAALGRYGTDRPGLAGVARYNIRYNYKCGHCGHQWSEVREKVAEGKAEGYTGD